MDKRKELVLETIIKEHIKTGAPVGSSVLAEKYKLNISSATVRNDMVSLEHDGYIVQPHTSAGRIPTEAAYRLYVSAAGNKKINKTDQGKLEEILKEKTEGNFKEAAKLISSLSGNTVFWAFHRHNLYYTGISNLFQQPEFSQVQLIYDISAVIDRIDEIIDEFFDDIKPGVQTFIGSDSPFGGFSSAVISKYHWHENDGLFGILGPMRMDYEKNITLAKFINQELSEEK